MPRKRLPIAPNVDLRDYRFMPFDVVELAGSETWAKAKAVPGASRALINLWCKSWHQVPAGSLPDDDELLEQWADLGPNADWKAVRILLYRGYKQEHDGRLYHAVLCKKAVHVWEKRESKADEKEADRVRKRTSRNIKKQKTQPNQAPCPPDGTGRVQRTFSDSRAGVFDSKGEYKTPPISPPNASGGHPPDSVVDEPLLDTRTVALITAYADLEAEIFGGQRRPWPNGKDSNTVRAWASRGATVELVMKTARPILEARHANAELPPTTMAYLDKALDKAIAAAQSSVILSLEPDPERRKWRMRLAEYRDDPKSWNFLVYDSTTPDCATCKAPPDLLEEFGYRAKSPP
ncbi:MAG: hypothetical protein ACR2RE_29990 [Geminicoccaceae bacterium]